LRSHLEAANQVERRERDVVNDARAGTPLGGCVAQTSFADTFTRPVSDLNGSNIPQFNPRTMTE
jgi:hypothetical protein